MKLDRLTGAALAVSAAAVLALASGCSSTPAPRNVLVGEHTAQGPRVAPDPSLTDTTSLMSAQLPAAAPKVGKAHLALDGDDESTSTSPRDDDDVYAPKEARRSDGSRRSGGFGSIK